MLVNAPASSAANFVPTKPQVAPLPNPYLPAPDTSPVPGTWTTQGPEGVAFLVGGAISSMERLTSWLEKGNIAGTDEVLAWIPSNIKSAAEEIGRGAALDAAAAVGLLRGMDHIRQAERSIDTSYNAVGDVPTQDIYRGYALNSLYRAVDEFQLVTNAAIEQANAQRS